jgi:hypothetical protein
MPRVARTPGLPLREEVTPMFKLFVLALLAGGWLLAAASLHVVRTPANFLTVSVVPKNELTFNDTYVDTRAWTAEDLPAHQELVRRVVYAGKSEILAHVLDTKGSKDAPAQLTNAVGTAPASQPAPAPSASSVKTALAQLRAGKIHPADFAKMVAGAQ